MHPSRPRSLRVRRSPRAELSTEALESRQLLSVDVRRPDFLPMAAVGQGPVIVDVLSGEGFQASTTRPRELSLTAADGRSLVPTLARRADLDADGDLDLSVVIPRHQLRGLSSPLTIRVSSPAGEIGADTLIGGFDPGDLAGVATQSEPGEAEAGDVIKVAPIDNQYIVRFKDSVSASQVESLSRQFARFLGGSVIDTYGAALKGFTATISARAAASLARSPLVEEVEQDQAFTVQTTQTGATWGIDRIDQRDLPLSTTYTYTNTGAGVKAYILDTGIRTTHIEFDNGRAIDGYDFIDNDAIAQDGNGHGTHVAGTVGGKLFGVAKGVTLVGVRVLNNSGSGTISGIVSGINWVVNDVAAKGGPAVANMSLGGSASSTLDSAVKNAIAQGVTFVVAAGNSNRDAKNFSPARVPEAITVGATTSSDARASYSNYGSLIDVFAPGSSITSAWYTADNAAATLSGTSMASPHVAGVAALYLQSNPTASPQTVRDYIVNNSTKNKVTNARSTNNHLLFTDL